MKKYYWLKMPRDYYKRHDIVTLLQQFGTNALHFYNKLLFESIDHEGKLRFSEKCPFNVHYLSAFLQTTEDIFTPIFNFLIDTGMIEIMEDGTLYFPFVSKRIGNETDAAERMRKHRNEHSKIDKCNNVITKLQQTEQCYTDIEIDKDIDIDKKKKDMCDKSHDKHQKKFIPPILDEVKEYCQERNNNVDAEKWFDFYQSKGWMVGRNKMKDWKAAVRTWEKSKDVISQKNANPFMDYATGKKRIGGDEE